MLVSPAVEVRVDDSMTAVAGKTWLKVERTNPEQTDADLEMDCKRVPQAPGL